MNNFNLFTYVKETLQLHGCIVEEQANQLNVLLSPDLLADKNFIDLESGSNDYVELFFEQSDYHQSQTRSTIHAKYLTYGSDFLNRLNALTGGKATVSTCYFNDLYLKKSKLDEMIYSKFEWVKMKPVPQSVKEELHSYLLLNFKYKAISDDRKEGLVQVILSEQSLAAPLAMISAVENNAFATDNVDKNCREQCSSKLPLKNLLDKAVKLIQEQVTKDLGEFLQSMQRRKKRDLRRINEFYSSLKSEVETGIQKRQLDDEELLKQKGKLQAVNREHRSKRTDIDVKYTINTTLSLFSAARVYMPVVTIDTRVLKGKQETNQTMVWNPLIKDLDPVVCARCQADICIIYPADDLRLICENCHSVFKHNKSSANPSTVSTEAFAQQPHARDTNLQKIINLSP